MSVSKFAKLGMTALRSNFTELSKPYKLTFSITYWCQSRCLTCSIWEIKPRGELTLDEIREFAKKNNHFKWIEITGGEPFMRGDILEIVRAFKENCKDLFLLTMPTNSLCNHEMEVGKIEEMLKMGIPMITITLSLDGYRELHDKIRGIPGNFDKVMDMARRLHALQERYKGLAFVFGYTMSKFNAGQLNKTVEEVQKELPWARFKDFHVNVGQVSDIYYSNTKLEFTAEREQLAKEIDEIVKNRPLELDSLPIFSKSLVESAFLRKLVTYIKEDKVPMKSRSLDASLFMDSYGNVYPSIMWGRRIGNIKESQYSLDPIWHNAEAEAVRQLIKEGKEPKAWTACEAYQTIVGNVFSLF